MGLKNVLIVVKDIEKSKAFYRQLFGLDVAVDMGTNVILTEGLVLQDKVVWEKALGHSVTEGGLDTLLYFEEMNLDLFLEKIRVSEYDIEYLHPVIECDGQRIVRIYDPDRHVIEVRENTFEREQRHEHRI